MAPTDSSLPSTPLPRGPGCALGCLHSAQAGMGLTCKVDGHGHNDDDDPYDDEADAEHPGQAAQPPGPVQVPLLHATSRLQRGGRGLRKAVLGSPVGPWPGPPEHTQCPLRPALQPPGLRGRDTNQACPWPAEDGRKRNQEMQNHRTTGWNSEDQGPERADQAQATLSWWEQVSQAPADPRPSSLLWLHPNAMAVPVAFPPARWACLLFSVTPSCHKRKKIPGPPYPGTTPLRSQAPSQRQLSWF